MFKRFFKPKKKCCLCNLSHGVLSEVEWYGHYNNRTWNYHPECLSKVLGNPEQYKHLTVDKAIEIAERIIEDRNKTKEQLSKIGELQVELLGIPL